MKKLTIVVLLLIAAMYTKAQDIFTVKDLEKLCSYSFANFESNMIEHDYYKSGSVSNDTLIIFLSSKKRSNGTSNQCNLTKIFRGNIVSSNAAFSTTDKSYYLNAKKYFQDAGYKFIKTESTQMKGVGNIVEYYYSDNKFTASIYTFTITGDNYAMPWYAVQVYKN
jgi:hypothetical protein